ncbi:receptor-type tyrosine-protein phosphatase N2 isoform X3 [Frankliniella occidentalis]|uniref:Receptor-type tyrosine-protein phosphatase N2 isoform X3 n=1 Tax=Frankliniella occidentalis TaxID=133901 RepID=A0A9C6X7Y8_FRAOC|nr:receptor-type tyrosine-protein phosphatase N2 isoform X3 [Frankliniella occidentalis]
MRLPWASALGALCILGCTGLGAATEYLGCLFDANLCDANEECFDDRVLGKCFNPLKQRPSEMKTYRWFSAEDVDILQQSLGIMFDLGYYWDDDYMQCVLGVLIDNIETQTYGHDYTACRKFRGLSYERQYNNEVGNARNAYALDDSAGEATIRFTPPDGVYADEVYYPQAGSQPDKLDLLTMAISDELRQRGQLQGDDRPKPKPMDLLNNKRADYPAGWKQKKSNKAGTRAMRKLMMDTVSMDDGSLPFLERRQDVRMALRPEEEEAEDSSLADLAMMYMAAEERRAALAQAEAEDAAEAEAVAAGPGSGPLRMFSAHYNTPTSFRQGLEYRVPGDGFDGETGMLPVDVPRVVEAGDEPLVLEDVWETQERPAGPWPGPWPLEQGPQGPGPRGFSKLYNTPDMFRAGLETKDVEPGLASLVEEQEAEPEVWMDTDTEPRGVEYESVPGGAVFIRPNRRGSPDEEVSQGQPEQEEQLVQQSGAQQQPQQPAPQPPQPQPAPPQQTAERAEEAEQAMKEFSHMLDAFAAEGKEDSVPDEIQAEEDEVDRAETAAGTGASMGRAYTEGGLVFLPDQQTDRPETLDGRSLDALLKEWRGFERRERLDVKKPGPSYNVNNFFFQRDHEEKRAGRKSAVETNEIKGEPRFEAIHASPPVSMQHKNYRDSQDGETLRDPNVVSVKFKSGFPSWAHGDALINVLATTLNQMPSAFRMRRVTVNDGTVSFKVDPATSTLTGPQVARQIMLNKEEIKKRVNADVASAFAGKPVSRPKAAAPEEGWEGDALLLGSVVLGVTLSAAVISLVTYYAVRRVQLSREKLRGMAAPDTEASKDYQDLCRARMAKKAEAEQARAQHETHVDARLASLSRESEGSNNSPSSRSSTSSWTEEPALTNMDISTGHMVLAYMEDHLKNKDRLEQEWQGLCAYEAEPCETTVAEKPENQKKNRYYPHVLPYDHSRVVLNELANATGSDYINASTITDHDPRNPAYLATQGPLPHTAADLWQLVWEQGSVVMVMLSRLTENGTAMCHRYWPEEGSELYHIYEVHLVSEHIWCDDYLVRSFYLKNLKTGETRTVTQFHFLSWPDHGVPPNTKPLLDFRRKVNKSYRGRSCPIVVHCSDGAGRTGTYSLIDMVLNRMAKGAKEIDIAATLEHIRDQRANMVESKEQFEFCLQAVADEVHAILKALPAQPTPPATTVVPPPTSPGSDKEKEKEKEKKDEKAKEQPKKKT